MSHRNARLNQYGRQLLVDRILSGRPVAHVAAELGVSRQCAHRWLARYRHGGADALLDRSSRPHHSPTRTPAVVEQRLVELRRVERRGQDWLGPETGVPARTVSRVLRRHDVPYLRDCDPLTGALIRSSKQTAVRYERDRPGELVHMDVKKIGKIPDGGGWKAHGRADTVEHKHKKIKIGYDYVHFLIDDHSRLAYSEILPDETGSTCAEFLRRAIGYLHDHGITRIERLMTDNAWAYRWSLRAVCAEHGIIQKFIRPHCPWQNGKVERLNRTLQTEWAYRQVFSSNTERAAALAPWIEFYNTRRRHTALGGLPPVSRLSPT